MNQLRITRAGRAWVIMQGNKPIEAFTRRPSIYVKQIRGVWAIMAEGKLIECYDTKADAMAACKPLKRQRPMPQRSTALEAFDRQRPWESLYDREHGISKPRQARWGDDHE